MSKTPTLRSSIPSFRRILARFAPHFRKHRSLIAASSCGLFAEVAFRLIEPWPLKFVFDAVIVSTPPEGTGVATIDNMPAGRLLLLCAIAVVVIATCRAVSTYMGRVGFALVGNHVLTESRAELFAHLQRLSLSYHNTRRTGDLITRVTADIGRLKEVAVTALLPLLVNAVTLVAMLGVMFWMDWRLGLVAMSIFPLFLLSTRRIGGRIRTVARKQRQREGEIGASTAEAMGSIKTVQSLNLEAIQQRTFSAQNKSSLKEGVKAKRLSVRLVGTVDVLVATGTAIVIFFGARMVLDGTLTPGDLIVFLAYLKNAFKPMRDVAKYVTRIARAAASAERVVEVLETEPDIVDRPDARPAPAHVERIAFRDITFGYDVRGTKTLALDHVDLEAREGQVIALVGPSGAGKSTALDLLLRLYDPQAGRIEINGVDLRDYTVESLRRSIAVVPQENVLFAVSVRENIAYGDPDASEEQIVAAARTACAHEFIERLPQGYDTILGERGQTVSEGQRHRIAIARAALRGAPILILDEPAVSLDNENSQLVREALRRLSAGRITFVIAHDLSLVEDADQILFLDDGRIAERGTHRELLDHAHAYAAMHALQRSPNGSSVTGQDRT